MKSFIKTFIAAATLTAAGVAPALADDPSAHGYRNGYGHGNGHAYGHPNGRGYDQGRPLVAPAYIPQHPLAGLREINHRQAVQRARIERGFHHGGITRREFRRLMAEQHDIAAMEQAFVSDGFLAPHERAELHRRLDLASRHIVAEARDHERRY